MLKIPVSEIVCPHRGLAAVSPREGALEELKGAGTLKVEVRFGLRERLNKIA
jgi:hypothetical protein